MGDRPGGVFVYDSLDKENPTKKSDSDTKTSIRIDWKTASVCVFAATLLGICVFLFHQQGWYLITSGENRIAGAILLVSIYGGFTLAVLGSIAIGLNYLWNKSQRARLINAMEHQLTIDQLKIQNMVDQYYTVILERMKHTTFASAQNITYSPHVSKTFEGAQPTILEEISEEETETPTLSLDAMEQQGLIGRSGNSFLIGWGNDDE